MTPRSLLRLTAPLILLSSALTGGPLGCAAHAPLEPNSPESAPGLVPTASAQSAQSEPRPSLGSGQSANATSTADDTSLAGSVYRAAGVPEVDREWSVDDYQQGAGVLLRMLDGGRQDLPRKGSQRSGEVFARLVSAANFSSITRAETAASRARLAQQYLGVFPGLLQLYSPASDALDFAAEQGELIVALLELLKLALDSSRDYVVEDAAWQGDYDQQKTMAVGVLQGIGSMLGEQDRYAGALRQRLSEQTARLAPLLVRHLDGEQRRLVPTLSPGH